jgi:hypothetical protein
VKNERDETSDPEYYSWNTWRRRVDILAHRMAAGMEINKCLQNHWLAVGRKQVSVPAALHRWCPGNVDKKKESKRKDKIGKQKEGIVENMGCRREGWGGNIIYISLIAP